MSETSQVGLLEANLIELDTAQPSVELVDALNELAGRDEIDFQRRLALSHEAIHQAALLSYPQGRIRGLLTQGLLLRSIELGKALTTLFEARALLQNEADVHLDATVHREIGVTYSYLGQFSEALIYEFEALKLYRQAHDRSGEARTLNTLGFTHVLMGQPDRAISFYQQALMLYQALGDRTFQAMVLNNLADGYRAIGEHAQARAAAEESLLIHQELRGYNQYVYGYAYTLSTLATAAYDLGDLDQAEHYAHLAHQENLLPDGSFRHADVAAEALAMLGTIYRRRGALERAQSTYEKLLALSSQNGLKKDQLRALESLVALYEEQGNFVGALSFFKRCHVLKKELFNEKSDQQIRNLQVIHETETAQRVAQLLQSENRELEQTVAALERTKVELQAALQEIQRQTAQQMQLLEENQRQRRTIQELSVPVLPLTNDILVMPLVGVLDDERLQQLQDHALSAIQRSGAHHVLLDITGVPIVDSLVAQGIIATVHAARLLGASAFLIGIRPEVAQAIISIGLDLSGIRTTSSLQTALRTLAVLESVPKDSFRRPILAYCG